MLAIAKDSSPNTSQKIFDFFKQGKITKDQLGVIELKRDCAFVSVPKSIAEQLAEKLNNTRKKKKKVRVTILD